MARRGGCLMDGCLGVLGLALVIVVGVMVSMWNTGREAGAEARDQVTASVDSARAGLSKGVADGALLDTEIQRAVPDIGKSGEAIERRDGRVTVTARFVGMVNVGFGGTQADGCYRFDVDTAAAPPPVTVRELADKACVFRSGRPYREPAAVAEDITAELRTAVAEDGPEGARSAEVWKTPGIEVEDAEVRGGQLVALVWLSGGEGSQGKDCFEFRARAKPGVVTAKKLEPDGCYRLQREQDREQAAQAEKAENARRAELDVGAREIEQRLEYAMIDGRLTDTELERAIALPRIDHAGFQVIADPAAEVVEAERSSAGATVVARVQQLRTWLSDEGCYEFRAHLSTQSATRRFLEEGCPL